LTAVRPIPEGAAADSVADDGLHCD
jgi:hypothetical protein